MNIRIKEIRERHIEADDAESNCRNCDIKFLLDYIEKMEKALELSVNTLKSSLPGKLNTVDYYKRQVGIEE